MSNCKICGNESGKNVRCVVCTWDKSRDFTLHRSLAFLSEKSVEQYFAEKEKAESLAQEAEEQTQKEKTSRRSGWKSQSFWGRKNRVKAERGQEESRQGEESTVPEVTEIPKNPEFEEILKDNGIEVTVRREMGTDINAACGQLRRSYLEENR